MARKALRPVHTDAEARDFERVLFESGLGFRKRFPYILILFALLAIEFSFVRMLDPQFKEARFFAAWVEEIKTQTHLRIDVQVLQRDEKLKWSYFNDMFDRRVKELPKGENRLPIFSYDSIGYLWLLWYREESILQTALPMDFIFDDTGMIDTGLVRSVGDKGIPGFTSVYAVTQDQKESERQLAEYLGDLSTVINRSGGKLDAASVLANTITEASRDPWWQYVRLIAIMVFAMLATRFFRLQLMDSRIVLSYCLLRQKQYKDAGYPAPAPSVKRLMFAWSFSDYISRYKEQLEASKNVHIARLKEERQSELDRLEQERKEKEFEVGLNFVKTEMNGLKNVPSDVLLQLRLSEDKNLPLDERERAFVRFREKLASYRKLILLAAQEAQEKADEQELFSQVANLKLEALHSSQQRRIQGRLDAYHEERRRKKRMRYLEEILQISQEVYDSGIRSRVTLEEAPDEPDSETVPDFDFVEMLDLNGFLPKTIDVRHASEIILALLQPRKQWSCFNGRYKKEESVRNAVASKIMSPRFQQDLYAEALDWLLDQGVVLRPKPGISQVVLSLNAHGRQASSLGRPIIQKILSLAYTTKQKLHV